MQLTFVSAGLGSAVVLLSASVFAASPSWDAHFGGRDLTLPENRCVYSFSGDAGADTIELDRSLHASGLVFRGTKPLTLTSVNGSVLRTDATDVRSDATILSGAEALGAVRLAGGKTLTVPVPAGKTSDLGILRIAAPTDGDVMFPGGTLRKVGAGRLSLSGVAPYLLDGVTLEIAEGDLRTVAGPIDVALRNSTVAFRGTGAKTWEYTPNRFINILGNVTVDIAEGLTVNCPSRMGGQGKHCLIKRGGGDFVFCPVRDGFRADIREGAYLVDNDHTSGAVVTVRSGAAVGCFTKDAVFEGVLSLEDGAALKILPGKGVLTVNRISAPGRIRVLGLPDTPIAGLTPDAGLTLLKSAVRGLNLVLPDTWKTYSVFYSESAGAYVAYSVSDAAKTLTGDETWTPDTARCNTLTLDPAGHTLTLAKSLSVKNLVIAGKGTVVLAEGAELTADTVTAKADVRLPETFVFGSGSTRQPHFRIADGCTVSVASDAERLYSGCISGIPAADGIMTAGGVFRKEGKGRLRLIGNAVCPYAIDHATVEIDGGQLSTEQGTREFWSRAAGLRFVSGDTRWEYSRSKVIRSEGPLSVWVAKGHRVSCNSWQSGGIVKTGEGALQVSQDSGYLIDVREGIWMPDSEGDNRADSITIVRKGAWMRCGTDGPYANGRILFEDGAGILPEGGPVVAPRIEAMGVILVDGPANVLADGRAVLKTGKTGLSFRTARKIPLGAVREKDAYVLRPSPQGEAPRR